MWTFFKTLFNILRNISFAIVLAVVGCFAWIWTDEELKQEFVSVFNEETVLAEKIEENEVENLEEEHDEGFVFDEEDFVDVEDEGFGIQAVEEEKNDVVFKVKRIAIEKLSGSTIDLMPSEIMYYCKKANEKRDLEEYLIKNDNSPRIKTNSSVSEIYDKLEYIGVNTFFKTRFHVINCEQVIERGCSKVKGSINHRKCWAIMKNNDTIHIDKNIFPDFKRKMGKVSH